MIDPDAIHPKLAHLSQEQIAELMECYYKGEKAAALVKRFHLDIHANSIPDLFPPIICQDAICCYCSVPMGIIRQSRGYYLKYEGVITCLQCGHLYEPLFREGFTLPCRCKNCQKKQLQEEQAWQLLAKGIIERTYSNQTVTAPSVQELSLKNALYLITIVRAGILKDFSRIPPIRIASQWEEKPVAPTHQLAKEMVTHLHQKKLITVSPRSAIGGFEFDAEEITNYRPTCVSWELMPGYTTKERQRYIQELEQRIATQPWPASWKKEIKPLWRHIALHECLGYSDYISHCSFFGIRQITPEHIAVLLDHYSASQIFALINNAVEESWDNVKRTKKLGNGEHLHSELDIFFPQSSDALIIGNIEKGNRANVAGKKIATSTWPDHWPRSAVSKVFFDSFLGIGDRGLAEVPHKLEAEMEA